MTSAVPRPGAQLCTVMLVADGATPIARLAAFRSRWCEVGVIYFGAMNTERG